VFNNELLDVLQASKIFKGLSDDYLQIISSHGNILQIKVNDIIIEEGQIGHPLYVIVAGQVEVFLPKTRKGDMQERPTRIRLSRLTKGDCIGEYALIDNQPASASVVAMEPGKIFKISRSEFEKMIISSDHLAQIIYKNMLSVLIKRSRQYANELDICY
jgi:formate hydrogenlyase transcriptional activator